MLTNEFRRMSAAVLLVASWVPLGYGCSGKIATGSSGTGSTIGSGGSSTTGSGVPRRAGPAATATSTRAA